MDSPNKTAPGSGLTDLLCADRSGPDSGSFSVPASNSTKLAEVVSHMSIMSKDSLTQMGNKGHSYYLEHFDKSSVIDNIVRHL